MSTGSAVVTSDARPALATGGKIQPVIPQTMEDAWRLGKAIVAAGMAPRGMETPEKCMVAILRGLEVGLSPMQAVDKIAVVNGRPTIWGDGAMALVRASGLCEYVRERIEGEGDKRVAICETNRRGESEATIRRFSVSDAKEAGLWGKQGPWKQFPTRMLQMRARAFALRDLYADVLGGLYLREEIEDDRRQDGPGAPPPADEPRPQELAPPAGTSRGPAAPPAESVEEAEIVEPPSPAGGVAEAEQDEVFDPEAWLDEARQRFQEARTEGDISDVHEMFADTANDLQMVDRQKYEDMLQAAEARVRTQGKPEQAEVTGEPGPAPDEDDDSFPGDEAIAALEEPKPSLGARYLAKIRAAISDSNCTQRSLEGLWNETGEERKKLEADGEITKEQRKELREEIARRGRERVAQTGSGPAAPPATEQDVTAYDRDFRARVEACATIEEINRLSPNTLVERNRFTDHPALQKEWQTVITQKRKQLSGIV